MALSDVEVEAIHFKEFGYVATGLGQFARAIEAEVRKNDTELIRQLMEALERVDQAMPFPVAKTVLKAARARLEGKP